MTNQRYLKVVRMLDGFPVISVKECPVCGGDIQLHQREDYSSVELSFWKGTIDVEDTGNFCGSSEPEVYCQNDHSEAEMVAAMVGKEAKK